MLQNGKEQTLQFVEGDKLLFDFSKSVPVTDPDGNKVMERKQVKKIDRNTGVETTVENLVPVMTKKTFRKGMHHPNSSHSSFIPYTFCPDTPFTRYRHE